MIAYEIYLSDPVKGDELIGILPERRKDPRRITYASVMKWGKMILGNKGSKKSIFYEKVTINECATLRITKESPPYQSLVANNYHMR